MALDDVVIRAMSKSADDRYPSAGDLGRAAQAALHGESPVAPERTVATGAAATRTAETIVTSGGETRGLNPPTDPTRRLDDEAPSMSAKRGGGGDSSRRWALFGGVAALLVAVVAAIVLVSGGGGSSPGTTAAGPSATGSTSEEPKAKPEPTTLTKSELIVRADEICAKSKSTYTSVRSAALEETPDVPYAATLAGISQRGVNGFRRLHPPPSVEPAFGKYLAAQERVMRYDRQALEAAEANDTAAYLEARQRRDAEAEERYDLAREIGLEQCSTNRS
jgi:hypothetical protein